MALTALAVGAVIFGFVLAWYLYWLSQVGTDREIEAVVGWAEVMVAVMAVIGILGTIRGLQKPDPHSELAEAIRMALRPGGMVGPLPGGDVPLPKPVDSGEELAKPSAPLDAQKTLPNPNKPES